LIIEAGVIFNGNCAMENHRNPTKKTINYAKNPTFMKESAGK